jgi:hypothetical protein
LAGGVIGVLLLAMIALGVVFAMGGFDLTGSQPVAKGNRPDDAPQPARVRRPVQPVVRPAPVSRDPLPEADPLPATDPSPFAEPDTPAPTESPTAMPVAPTTPPTSTTPTPTDPTPTPAPPTPTSPPSTPSEEPLFVPDPSFTTDPTPMPTPTDPPPPNPTTEPAPNPAPMPMPMPTPTPTTDPPSAAPSTPPTAQELAELGAALTSARAALSELRIDDANAALKKAEPLARLPEHQAKFERLRRMADYVGRFREALAESVSRLEPASSITVGTSTQVGIVETFPDRLTVRVAGMNRSYTFAEMPVGLAVAIVDMALLDSPDARMVKGAYVMVSKTATDVNRDKAREWWESAGDQLGDLMSFPSDTYDFAPSGEMK